jgi:hypothetical protein
MNYVRGLWIVGGVVVASVLDLCYMFWSRSNAGGRFNKAIWNSSGLGRGNFNVMRAAKHMSYKGKP